MSTSPPVCPACGQPMMVDPGAVYDAQCAPWLCRTCDLGFWETELEDDARAFYDPVGRHHGALQAIVDVRRAQEAADALARGTSVTEAMAVHLAPDQRAARGGRVSATTRRINGTSVLEAPDA